MLSTFLVPSFAGGASTSATPVSACVRGSVPSFCLFCGLLLLACKLFDGMQERAAGTGGRAASGGDSGEDLFVVAGCWVSLAI